MENYRRPPATLRILRPIVGDGLLLSEGSEWRSQRRIIAPALANHVAPLVAAQVAGVATETVARFDTLAGQPVDLLAAMQELALEVAARSMFSLEMRRHGTALRALIARYRPRLGRPTGLDLILPTAIPTLRDLARMKFRSDWIALMDAIVAQRWELPASAAPRDLFDLRHACAASGRKKSLAGGGGLAFEHLSNTYLYGGVLMEKSGVVGSPSIRSAACRNGRAPRGPGIDRGIVFQEPRLLPWARVRENIGPAPWRRVERLMNAPQVWLPIWSATTSPLSQRRFRPRRRFCRRKQGAHSIFGKQPHAK